MNLYIITVSVGRRHEKDRGVKPMDPLTELHTFKIPAEDLDAATVVLELDLHKQFGDGVGWSVKYIYSEPMRSIPNYN